jgi:starch phosphorylase
MTHESLVGYFSMEIGLDSLMPTYAGGLGVLAGDTLRSAADIEFPMVAVTLLHRRGYFYQRFDSQGWQTAEPVAWPINDFLDPVDPRVTVEVENRKVAVSAWRYEVKGLSGFVIPVYLLDTDLPENSLEDRRLTDSLYGGDQRYRLSQEVVLGLGGVRMLRALGHKRVARFHLNEGHAALLILALLEEQLSATNTDKITPEVLDVIRKQCVFTTHTPVLAGHDRFSSDLAQQVLGASVWNRLKSFGQEAVLNMTDLALHGSQYINGVAMKHGEVSRGMFPGYPIHSITNGVHTATWTAPAFRSLYDRHLPEWRRDPLLLRYAISIPPKEIWEAHAHAKLLLTEHVNRETNAGFDKDVFTIGFARRATAYKRGGLLFHNLERLREVAAQHGPIQIVFAGKAHPQDQEGQEMIRQVHQAAEALRGVVPVAYLANYDMELAKLLCAGVDVWLNSPLPPMEASGTSGMKAAVNAVPSLSILDGWWIEGHVEGVTGWSIGGDIEEQNSPARDLDDRDAAALCIKLANVVLPCFYQNHQRYVEIMRFCIAMNGSFFNTHRMLGQYIVNAYRLSGRFLQSD